MTETVGGKRPRGARKKLNSQNTEDVTASQINIDDMVLHPNFREPITITAKTTTGGLVTFSARHQGDPVNWQIAGDATIKRVLPEPEEAEG